MQLKKDTIIANFWGCFLLFLVAPLCLLLVIGSLLYTPIDYIKFKRSRYQKDFPRKYKWLCGTHVDNKVYTVVKENDLPISYLRFYEDYALGGDFFYKDTVLDFSRAFFFDDKKEAWLFWPHNDGDPDALEAEDTEAAEAEDDTDDCLTEEESRAYILGRFRERYPNVPCTRIVFFYEERFVKSVYGDLALEKMKQNDAFVLYQKDGLKEAIQELIAKTEVG